jgi:ABC-type Na+ transport system ATPase subunit NatA
MLKHIDIKNFRSCYSTSIAFDEGVCAIVGKNGVGKTNVLKCIEWIASTSISTDPVNITPAGNVGDETDEVSTRLVIELTGGQFEYSLTMPSLRARGRNRAAPLRDSLALLDRGGRTEIFRREGEKVFVGNRPEPIRVARSTPSIAALLSLLPENDDLQEPLSAVRSFLAGVRYYALVEREGFRDFVTEQQYNDWLIKYQNEGLLTSSVALRLIYMWSEDKEKFEELRTLLESDGLGLLERLDVVELNTSVGPQRLEGDATKTKLYLPVFAPSEQMGGAGRPFPFSDLSVGTRRVIRLVTSLLFDKRSLMLMEQPEDSVHPGLLRKLIDTMRSYSHSSQVIFTTHSSEVLDILRPEEVLLATARGGGTSVRRLSPDEVARAQRFLSNEGSLSDFLEPFDEP